MLDLLLAPSYDSAGTTIDESGMYALYKRYSIYLRLTNI
jgi:hypothetical protein